MRLARRPRPGRFWWSARSAVIGIMALAYRCYRVIGEAYPLTTIGLVSFAAVAQFAPALSAACSGGAATAPAR